MVPGTIVLTHNHACIRLGKDAERARSTLFGIGRNPNVYSILVVGLGCEPIKARELAEGISLENPNVGYVSLDESGKYERLIEDGVTALKALALGASEESRVHCDISELTIGIKCGGSGSVSAISSNPSVGFAADMIVNQGGTVIFTETAELIGAEQMLAKRACCGKVHDNLLAAVQGMRDEIEKFGVDILGSEPTQGNILSGLTTIEEKSLGAIIKSGTSPLMGVLEYAQKPRSKGLFFMDGTTQASQLFLGMASSGAQIQIFSFGGGLPARFRGLPSYPPGLRIVPVLKVLGSSDDEDEKAHFDIYAGDILKSQESIQSVGSRLFDAIVATASGQFTHSEKNQDYHEMLQIYANGLLM